MSMENLRIFIYCFFLFLFIANAVLAQNLIKNGSFEEVFPKQDERGIDSIAFDWKKLTGGSYNKRTFDLVTYKMFNNKSHIGIQNPRTGTKMVWIMGTVYDGKHNATYIAQKLVQPLKKGHKYRMDFYVNLGESSGYYIQEIGAFFSDKPIMPYFLKGKGTRIHDNYPQITSDSLLGNWNKWMRISGEFVAKGGEQFMVIGGYGSSSALHTKKIEQYKLNYHVKKLDPNDYYVASGGYYYFIDDISLNFIEVTNDVEKLTEIKVGESLIFENIYFDTSSARLLSDSKEGLESLLSTLNENPKLAIEIAGHTDNKGEADFNLQLSKKRAQAVGSYLLANGIEKNRLKPKGYGDTQPIAKNDTMLGRQRNRRVEIKVLSR